MMQKNSSANLVIYVVLLLAFLFFVLPAWFAFVNSIKPLEDIIQGNVLGLPNHITFDAWSKAWNTACTGASECGGLKGYFINSILVVVPATIIGALWGCFNGYVLAKWPFRRSEAVLFVLMFGSFIPIGLFLFPLTIVFDHMGLASSLMGLTLVYIIYSINGAGLFSIFIHVVLHTARPILMVVVIMSFTNIWNDFLFALVLAPSDSQTVTVGLNNLITVVEDRPEYNVHMAAALIAALPTALIYAVAGKQFVRGLTAGAVKG
jgi:glucose/mannose transport system permease protein